jgi:hypothetical protein
MLRWTLFCVLSSLARRPTTNQLECHNWFQPASLSQVDVGIFIAPLAANQSNAASRCFLRLSPKVDRPAGGPKRDHSKECDSKQTGTFVRDDELKQRNP